MYFLRHPLTLLQDQPDKEMFKSQVKLSVQEYWQKTLRGEAESLHSLTYFKPNFMSLSKPHPLWITCGSNPYEVNKACIFKQSVFLGGSGQILSFITSTRQIQSSVSFTLMMQ